MLKKYFLALLLFFSPILYGYEYDLAICAISRDDEPFLKEWIEFHKLVGVQHFYIFCHGNWDNYVKILQPYIQAGELDLYPTDYYDKPEQRDDKFFFTYLVQTEAYTDLCRKVRGVVKWLAVIDTDEFLFSPKKNRIMDILRKFEKYSNVGGICVNWQIFGTSNIKEIPKNKLMIEVLTLQTQPNHQENYYIKSIVRPERTHHFEGAHHAYYEKGFHQINTEGTAFCDAKSPHIQIDKLRINHYWTRDENFFWNYKVPRWTNWGDNNVVELWQDKIDERNQCYNNIILRFVPKLKMNMELNKKKYKKKRNEDFRKR